MDSRVLALTQAYWIRTNSMFNNLILSLTLAYCEILGVGKARRRHRFGA
ncbi:hypothetical protein GXM_01519 [Nostoc sphaeroides CCNUC1]|uniref:Uncharacterized protein n=1 Tax=Nostoc sphaeroides CCNUC1 TaxID=2653204 RepID=A0A5P8VV87_9NOSO|nr:hypothetical protein GXM_01519 [Nostoc sphaeroides CCNUC1]